MSVKRFSKFVPNLQKHKLYSHTSTFGQSIRIRFFSGIISNQAMRVTQLNS